MKCAYCGKETKGTREHIISCAILDLFPECYLTIDETRKKIYQSDPMVKDVCAVCNNERISYIDSYAKQLISKYFIVNYTENDIVEVEYDYVMIQKMLLKYAFNDMRAQKEDCDFYDEEILHFLLNESENTPKKYITVLGGLAVNVTPVPDVVFGNIKLRWCKEPIFLKNSTIRNIDYETGDVEFNENVEKEVFRGLKFSYIFKFNSAQFLLLCWDKNSEAIEQNNIILKYQYPYYLLNENDKSAILPICTDEMNYFNIQNIHVNWDRIFEVQEMRKCASGGEYTYKEKIEEQWKDEEERLRKEHPRE